MSCMRAPQDAAIFFLLPAEAWHRRSPWQVREKKERGDTKAGDASTSNTEMGQMPFLVQSKERIFLYVCKWLSDGM